MKLCQTGRHDTDVVGRRKILRTPKRNEAFYMACLGCVMERQERNAETKRLNREVDDVVVDRLVCGDYSGRTTSEERRIATDILTKRGVSITQTARLIGCSDRSVQRYRDQLKRSAS